MWIVYVVIYGCIWGFVTQKVIDNKGYSDNWFWWGFFFGFFATIIAATKPQCHSDYETPTWTNNSSNQNSPDRSMMASGGWICSCGRTNPSYTGTCSCGQSKYGSTKNQAKVLAVSPLTIAANEAEMERIKREASKIIANGGWRCRKCGKGNPDFINCCVCGMTRRESKEIDKKYEQEAEEAKKVEEVNREEQLNKDKTKEQMDKFEEIKKYKDLLDNGIITEEEFNKKKSEFLGL